MGLAGHCQPRQKGIPAGAVGAAGAGGIIAGQDMMGGTDDGHAPGALARSRRRGGLSLRLRRLLTGVVIVLAVVIGIETLELTPSFPMTFKLMQTQDIPVLLLSGGLLLAWAAWGVPAACSRWAQRIATGRRVGLVAVVIAAAGVAVALGTHFIAFDYGLSRDEAMAIFDAKIIASGRLLGPVAPEWRPFVPALQPEFRLPVPGDVAWASSYLPGNAALRAALGAVISSAIVNATLAVVALVALLGTARLLWPERPDAWIVAVVLAASSSQLLFMSMTPYAMSAHLALNLVWLWLFVRNSPVSHAGALATGFVATGLHQLVFHPLFAAPFILQMLLERRWRLSAVYIASYGAIGMFWIVYWQLLLSGAGIAPEAASAVGTSWLASRLASLLANFSVYGIETMAQNLLRFAAWQNPLMLVLFVPGFALAWRAGGTMRPLAGGIVLTLLAMFILLPYQDIGWGYRYAHGLIGNVALLAASGWISLAATSDAGERRAAFGLVLAATAVSVLILAPIHAIQMRSAVAPYARASAEIASRKTDVVIVDAIAIYYGIDLVRNDPDLTNRPLTFDIGNLNERLVRDLCSRFTISVFDGKDAARFGIDGSDATNHSDYVRLRDLRAFAESAACREMRAAR